MFFKKLAVALVSNVMFLPLLARLSRIRRVTKIEVMIEVMIPMISVVAKPLIGPEPKAARTIPVRRVVT